MDISNIKFTSLLEIYMILILEFMWLIVYKQTEYPR